MAWYGDLSACDYFRTSEPERLLAVGWLAAGRPFTKGDVSRDVLEKIDRLAEHALNIFIFRGFHVCELCGGSADERLVDVDGRRIASSSHLNIFVPDQDRIFVAPQNLPHYITAHGYCPPDEFCEAVLRCPNPESTELTALLAHVGGTEFVEQLEMAERLRIFMTRSEG